MRFLVDAQLPPALARRLEAWGHVAEHVVDLGMAAAPDHRIREYAAAVGAVIVTKDEDFAVWRLLHHGPAVVWLRIGNTRRTVVLARIGSLDIVDGFGVGHGLRAVRVLPATEGAPFS